MGNNLSPGINTQANLNAVGPDEKVRFYSKDNFTGNIYVVDYGNYTVSYFADKISPDSVFSMIIPPLTTVGLFCGEIYDYGGQGAFHVTNITKNKVSIPQFPEHIQGRVKSVSIIKHDANYSSASAIIDSSLLGINGLTNSQLSKSNLTSVKPNVSTSQTGQGDNTISNYKIESFDHDDSSKHGFFITYYDIVCFLLIVIILLFLINYLST